MSRKSEHEKIIQEIQVLQETPERDPQQAARARAQFLREAKQISEEPVSISWFQRLSSVFRAPQLQMSTLTIAIILGFLLVSFSTSAAAANQALPNEFLYPYKLWLEEQRLTLTINPEKETELHLRYAQARLAELQALSSEETEEYLERILDNYNHHLDAAELFILESEDHDDKEDLLHWLETQAPDPTEEIEAELEEDQEDFEPDPTETPEPESPEEPDDTEEPEESEEPEETEESETSTEPKDTPESGETDSEEDDNTDPDHTDEPDKTEEPDKTKEPDDTEEPDDGDD